MKIAQHCVQPTRSASLRARLTLALGGGMQTGLARLSTLESIK
jgi:hypothetical protein